MFTNKIVDAVREAALKLKSMMEPELVDGREYQPIPGAKVIKDLRRGERFARSLMLGLRQRQFWVRCLSLEVKGNESNLELVRKASLKPRNHSRAIWYAQIHKGLVRISTHGLLEPVERFSDMYLIVSYPENVDYTHLLDMAIIVYDNEYYWGTWGKPESFTLMVGENEDAPAKAELFDEAGNLVEGALLYNASGEDAGYESSSAGETKRLSIPFICQNMPGLTPRQLKYIMTDGASELLVRDAEVSGKEMAQANNRQSQHDAPQTAFGKLGVVCWFMGKFRNEKGEDHTDGLGYLSAEYFARLLSALSEGKYNFMASAVKGLAVQMRPAMCKLLAWCVSGKVIQALMKRYSTEAPLVLLRSEVTEEDIEVFARVIRDKEKIEGISGRNLILCDTEEERTEILSGNYQAVQFYTDLNGLKAPYDMSLELDMGVLDISHAPHDIEGAKTSTQLLQSLMIEDMAPSWKGVASTLKRLLDKKEEMFMREVGVAPSVKMFAKGQSLSQALVMICPVIARKFYFPLLKSVINKMVEGLVNKVGNLNLPCKGIYSKILPDPAVNFGVHILKVEKGGIMNVIHEGAARAGFERGIGIKYPKQHFREFAKSQIHDTKWYIEQVKANEELGAEQKAIIIDMVSQLSEGCVIIPAYDAVMHMLAGLDYDGDAMIMYLEKWIVDILWDVEPLSVYID